MEKKRWVLIFSALCLALAFSVSSVEAQDNICMQGDFCDSDHDGFFRDHKRCRECGEKIDCDDNDIDVGGPPCSGGEEDTKPSKKNIDLILTFVDSFGISILSDGDESYIDNEGVGVSAGGRSVPNPAAGIHMGMSRKNGRGRQLFLDITCEAIDDFPPTNPALLRHDPIDKCYLLPELDFGRFDDRILGHLPDCEVGNDFCDFGVAVRPYKVNCPGDPLCLDVFTMDPNTTELMSFRLGSPGLSVEVASAIGGDGSQDPGTCLSLHPDPEALAKALCDGEDCNVSVTAYNDNEGGENDAWEVVADGVKALLCHRRTGTVLGKATLTFKFNAIKKE